MRARLGPARPQDKVELQDLGGDTDNGSQHPDGAWLAGLGLWTEGCEAVSARSQTPIPSGLDG